MNFQSFILQFFAYHYHWQTRILLVAITWKVSDPRSKSVGIEVEIFTMEKSLCLKPFQSFSLCYWLRKINIKIKIDHFLDTENDLPE